MVVQKQTTLVLTSTTKVVYYGGMKELKLNKQKFIRAVEILGGQEFVGKICGFSQQAASKYATGKIQHFRPEYAVRIQIATSGKVTCQQLMPNFDWNIFFNLNACKRGGDEACNSTKP